MFLWVVPRPCRHSTVLVARPPPRDPFTNPGVTTLLVFVQIMGNLAPLLRAGGMGTISLNCNKQAGKRLLLNLFLVHIQLQKIDK